MGGLYFCSPSTVYDFKPSHCTSVFIGVFHGAYKGGFAERASYQAFYDGALENRLFSIAKARIVGLIFTRYG